MGTIKYPGLDKATGKQGFPPLVEGWYTVRVTKAPESEAKDGPKGPFEMLNFQYSVIEGPEQEDGKPPKNRVVFDSVFIPHEGHTAYETQIESALNRFKARCNAANVDVGKGGSWDPEHFIDSEFEIYVKQRTYENDEGVERIVNEVTKVRELQ